MRNSAKSFIEGEATRREWLRLGTIGAFSAPTLLFGARTNDAAIVAVSSADVQAYDEALEGMRASWADAGAFQILKLDRNGGLDNIAEAFSTVMPGILICVGSSALRAAKLLPREIPFFSTMVLASPSPADVPRPPAGVITLDVPIRLVASRLKALFPETKSLGVIRSAGSSADDKAEFSAAGAATGLRVLSEDCSSLKQLLTVFQSFRGRADFVLCQPDSALFNATTIKPLIRRSLELRLPIVGFSDAFARSGAAVGIYPDFYDIGAQTAGTVEMFQKGRPSPDVQRPRQVRATINQRVLRIHGLRYKPPKDDSGDAVVLR